MKVIHAPTNGFCSGVKKAVSLALLTAEKGEPNVFMLGEIVHNAKVVSSLLSKGLKICHDIKELKRGDTLIVSAHGAPKNVFDFALENGINLVDATCEYVKKVQNIAAEKSADGYAIVIFGEKDHTEIIGVNGWCGNSAIVLDGNSESDLSSYEKVLVLFQTTFPERKVESALQKLKNSVKTLEKINTICYTASARQKSAEQISGSCDTVLVIGGSNSSNTRRLFEICKSNCGNTLLVSEAVDLIGADFTKTLCLGVIAGASTPDELIQEVLSVVDNLTNEGMEVVTEVTENEAPLNNSEAVEAAQEVTSESEAVQEAAVEAIQQEIAVEEKPAENAKEAAPKKEPKPKRAPAKKSAEPKADTADGDLMRVAAEKFAQRKALHKGQKVKGIIQHIANDGVTVGLENSKKEGFIPNEELTAGSDYTSVKKELKVGDKIEVIVLLAEKEIYLSRKEVEELYKDDKLVDSIKEGAEFKIVAQKEVKGGLLGKLGSYTVFVPSSQIRSGFVKELNKYVGKELRLVAMKDGVDEGKKKIVASQRAVVEGEKKAWEENFWSNIEVGEIVEGKVLRFAPFGAFVSVRGFDCLAHLSDLAWSPVKEPGEVLELNKSYEFVVLKTDRDANRISIGYKQLQSDPWQVAFEKHPIGSNTQGKVVRLLPFGAFVEIEPGIDGLLHVSNVTWDWVDDIKKVLKLNDIINVQVTEFIPEQKRITLSRKATMEPPADIQNNQ